MKLDTFVLMFSAIIFFILEILYCNKKKKEKSEKDSLVMEYMNEKKNILNEIVKHNIDILSNEINTYDNFEDFELAILDDSVSEFNRYIISNIEDNSSDVTDEIIHDYINKSIVPEFLLCELYEKLKESKVSTKELVNNDSFATETVSNNTQIDSSRIDITDKLNNIFFND